MLLEGDRRGSVSVRMRVRAKVRPGDVRGSSTARERHPCGRSAAGGAARSGGPVPDWLSEAHARLAGRVRRGGPGGDWPTGRKRGKRGGPKTAEAMGPQLGVHELLHVFSFLEARDLLRAAQVDKVAHPGWGRGP